MNHIGIIVTDPAFYSPQDPDNDTVPLIAALATRGAAAQPLIWGDPTVDWASYDLLVIRSPWDYVDRSEEFASWLETVEESGTRLLNSPRLIRWNMDKHYLTDVAAAGIPVIPTTYHDGEESFSSSLDEMSGAVVVKPTIGAGSSRTGLFAASDPAALALARETLALGGTVMLQPEVPELSRGKEKALYFVDGEFTHAIAKGALLERGGGYLGGVYQEHPVLVAVTTREQEAAARVIATIAEITRTDIPLYGRVDMVDSAEHGLVLLEAELFEPAFHLGIAPKVALVMADAILSRLPTR